MNENKIFSKRFTLTRYNGQYGINEGERTVLHTVYDSITELDNYDFITEQNGKLGYAHFNSKNDIELILPLYDAIIKKEHGIMLIKRENGEVGDKRYYSWYDFKNCILSKNIMHIRTFRDYDLFVSTRKCETYKLPFLKKWGEEAYVEIPYDVSADVLFDIPFSKHTLFLMVEEAEQNEYEYSFIIVNQSSEYTFSKVKKSKEMLFDMLPRILEDIECNQNVLWFLPRLK